MPNINIVGRLAKDHRWEYTVTVGNPEDSTQHLVTLEESHWRQLTDEKLSPEELVLEAFNFLLDRENKSAILSRFNLRQINDYFPDFEEHIKQQLSPA